MFTVTSQVGPRYVDLKVGDQQDAILVAEAFWKAYRAPTIVWSGLTKVFEANRYTMKEEA